MEAPARESGRLRVGVVGCGKIAEKHLNAYRKLDDVEVVVTDVVDRGRSVAEHYGAGWHDVPEEVIRGDFDVIDVCIPTPSHAQVIVDALAGGKHVFCEKPLARNLDEARRIEAAARDARTILSVGYLYRYHPAIRLAREVITEGIIGEPRYASFRLGGRGSHKAWKHRVETGGGAANEMLVHMLDLALWYFGEPRRAECLHADTVLPEREIEGGRVSADAEDLVLIRLEMENALSVLCQSDLITPGFMNHIEVAGTNGSLLTSILDYMPTSIYCKEARGVYDRGHTFRSFELVDLFELELRDFLGHVRGAGGEQLNSVHDSIRLMEVVESALPRAARS